MSDMYLERFCIDGSKGVDGVCVVMAGQVLREEVEGRGVGVRPVAKVGHTLHRGASCRVYRRWTCEKAPGGMV